MLTNTGRGGMTGAKDTVNQPQQRLEVTVRGGVGGERVDALTRREDSDGPPAVLAAGPGREVFVIGDPQR